MLTTNGGPVLYVGNNPNAGLGFEGIQSTPLGSAWHGIRAEKGEVEAGAILKREALAYMKENPGKTIWLSLRKIVYFWTPPFRQV